MRMALVKLALATGVGLVTLAACGSANDGFDPAVPTTVVYVAGSGQSGDVGDLLPEMLTVKTANFVGDPVAGVTVEWFVVSGDGSISSATDHFRRQRPGTGELGPGSDRRATGSSGGLGVADGIPHQLRRDGPHASPGWRWRRSGTRPLVHRLRRTLLLAGIVVGAACGGGDPGGSGPVAPPPTQGFAAVGGRAQRAVAGTTVPVPYTVRVTNAAGQPVADAAVRWTLAAASGSLSAGIHPHRCFRSCIGAPHPWPRSRGAGGVGLPRRGHGGHSGALRHVGGQRRRRRSRRRGGHPRRLRHPRHLRA